MNDINLFPSWFDGLTTNGPVKEFMTHYTSVVRPTLLYINSEAVIPAKAGIQLRKIGFRVKPGMTIKVKGLMTHYTRVRICPR